VSEEVRRRTSQAEAQIERHGPKDEKSRKPGLQEPKPWLTTLDSQSPVGITCEGPQRQSGKRSLFYTQWSH